MTENRQQLVERPEVIDALGDGSSRQFLIIKGGGALHIFTDVFSVDTHEDLARKHLNSAKNGVIGGYIIYSNGQVQYSRGSSTVPVASEQDMIKAWQMGVKLYY